MKALNRLALKVIDVYRRGISPLKRPCCRFYPTCSAYAAEAFSTYRFFKALRLTLRRLLRCNPLCKGGYDPVPLPERFNNGGHTK